MNDVEEQGVFDIVFDWVVSEAAQNGGDSKQIMDSCRKTMISLREVTEDSELAPELEMIDDMLPDVVHSIVERIN